MRLLTKYSSSCTPSALSGDRAALEGHYRSIMKLTQQDAYVGRGR